MPINDFTVGRDVSIDITGPNGPVRFSKVISFDSKPNTTKQKIKGLDGITTNLRFPDGWSGNIGLERQNSTVDDYFALVEANYYAGRNELPVTITETIKEKDGSISQFRYVNVILSLEDAGNKQADKSIPQKISFEASRRLKIS